MSALQVLGLYVTFGYTGSILYEEMKDALT